MQKTLFAPLLFLAFLLLTLGTAQAQAPTHLPPSEHAKAVAAFQRELNADYQDPEKSPLRPEVRRGFKGHPFFPTNYACYVEATLVRDSTSAPFRMPTSGPRTPLYRKYGELHFVLNNQPLRLAVYQNLEQPKAEYADYLFVPFTDLTNGHQSYGGGRYIDLQRKHIQNNKVQLDFNTAYNPYCAYTAGYSCPVPPAENRLAVSIPAGIMSDH